MNEVLAEYDQIKESYYLLDTGCGIGGASVFLAKTIGCRVMAITLVEKQVQSD